MSRFIEDPFFFMLAICLCNYSLPLPSSYVQVRNHCTTVSLWNIILDQGFDARAPFLRSAKNWESNRSSYEDVSRLTNRGGVTADLETYILRSEFQVSSHDEETEHSNETVFRRFTNRASPSCPPDIHWCITSERNSPRNDTHLCSLSPWYLFVQSLEHTQ